jgi:multiple sugar transport system substrate-binding protein
MSVKPGAIFQTNLRRRRFMQLSVAGWLLAGLTTNCRKSDRELVSFEDSQVKPTFDWRGFAGERVNLLLDDHPWTHGVEPFLSEFEAITGIQLQIEIVPEPDYFQVMESRLRAQQETPDVFFLPMDSTAYRLWQEDLLLPLTDFVSDPQLTAQNYNLYDFPENFRLAAMYPPAAADQALFGIPATFEVYILFYNKRLVREHLGGEVPKTMADLVKAATKINQIGQGEFYGAVMRGVKSDAIIDTVTGIVLDSWGNRPTPLPYNLWFDGDWSAPRFNDPHIVEALTTYAQLMQAGPSAITTIDWPQATQLFQAGKAAFYIDASLFGPSYENSEISAIAGDVGYTVLPQFRETSLTGHWLWGLGIPKWANQPQAAWLFVQWATSQTIEAKIAVATGGAPRFSSWLNPSVYTHAMNIDYALAVQTAMRTSRSTAVLHPQWNQIALAIATTIQDIYGGATPTLAVEQLQAQVKQLMAQAQESS